MNEMQVPGERVVHSPELESASVSALYMNTQQEVIVVTTDRVRLCLHSSLGKMGWRDRWLVPLGVLVPLVLAVTTTSFTKRFGIGGGEWLTVYIMLIIATVVWLLLALKARGREVTVDSIVQELAQNRVSIDTATSEHMRMMPLDTDGSESQN